MNIEFVDTNVLTSSAITVSVGQSENNIMQYIEPYAKSQFSGNTITCPITHTIEIDASSSLSVTKGVSSLGSFSINLSQPTNDYGIVKFRIRS